MTLSAAARTLLEHVPPDFERIWAARLAWRMQMHRGQVPPKGEWDGWLMQSGRGFGKTLTGAFDVAEHALDRPIRYGIVARTNKDVRDVCIEGETGVLAVLTNGSDTFPGMGLKQGADFTWNRSLADLELTFPNGTIVKGYSAEKPDSLRGPQHHRLWFEELAAWKDAHRGDEVNTAFNNAILGLRLGSHAQWIATTTPRRTKLILQLTGHEDWEQDTDDPTIVAVTRGTTYDNIDNLAPAMRKALLRYEGTHIGRQELMGEIVAEVEGAFWTLALIEAARIRGSLSVGRKVVGVDPSGGADTIGIVVAAEVPNCRCGASPELQPHFAVLEDRSLKATPEKWAARVIGADADLIVAERNYGGQMVESTIRNAWQNAPYKDVTASRGKLIRAEPISILYEQGRVHHLDSFPALEDEMTTYVAGEAWSPNRMDALVWALTELAANPKREWEAY